MLHTSNDRNNRPHRRWGRRRGLRLEVDLEMKMVVFLWSSGSHLAGGTMIGLRV